MLRKYIGDRAFYRRVIAVALPIIIQNGIANFVSLLDNIMIGQVGQIPMSGVAIVNQLMFVFNLCVFGATSGAGIFTAQFFGSGNEEGVKQFVCISEEKLDSGFARLMNVIMKQTKLKRL